MEGTAGQGVPVITIVDNETARGNVTRMAERAGAAVRYETKDDGIYLYIDERAARGEAEPLGRTQPSGCAPVIVVSSETMGRGEHQELGHILMRGFFHALGEVQPLPETIIFLNSGVKLVANGSPLVQDLRALSERGVAILACGTCLGYYALTKQIAAGEVSNMYTIAETLLAAGSVINL
jgi:selenium metabolism protein YedF